MVHSRAPGARRVVNRTLLLVTTFAGVAVLYGLACTTEEVPTTRPATFGAEISVDVLGPGRVQADVPGIDCPGACFARLVFPDGAARPTFTLTAIPTGPFVAFRGFRLERDLVGSRGNGPGECSPIMRRATVPAVDPAATSVQLPFGEERGDPPPGTEKACATSLEVPLAYRVTAVFDLPDFPADAGDGALLAVAPLPGGGPARNLGLAASRLYYTVDGNPSSIVVARFGIPPAILRQESVVSLFDVASHVVYQTGDGRLAARRPIEGVNFVFLEAGGAPCTAVTSDAEHVFCRRGDGRIDRFAVSAGALPVTVSGPVGPDLAVDDAGDLYVSSSTDGTIRRLAPVGDGGIGSTLVATGESLTRSVRVSATRVFWLADLGQGRSAVRSTAKAAPGQVNTLLASAQVEGALALDPRDPSVAFAIVRQSDGKQSIVRIRSTEPPEARPVFVTTGITSLVVADLTIYWSSVDGSIYAVPRLD